MSALLQSTPPIPGFHQSIIIPPRRLHLTLGVMSLSEDSSPSDSATSAGVSATGTVPYSSESTQKAEPSSPNTGEGTGKRRTLAEACAFLESLRPKIVEILEGERLSVGLEQIDVMKPDRGDSRRAHVMWLGPVVEGEAAKRLKAVGSMYEFTCSRCLRSVLGQSMR